jgi:hypothetical protein
MRKAALSAVVALALVAACDKKSDAPAPATSASAAPTGSIGAAVTAAGDSASEEDFEDQAETEITEDNFDAELAKMEKELP